MFIRSNVKSELIHVLGESVDTELYDPVVVRTLSLYPFKFSLEESDEWKSLHTGNPYRFLSVFKVCMFCCFLC